eukprot:TRINITY_DN5862_c0_g1_i1.p4 TRINITY_DN5862_c0_g1~~TRINITY_DN5862_c0_g1_i1.p4  ORF type:complete len:85 (-),score=11.85 TRINITY_DN5862_c0_g1_i1:780-1034(-)
MGREYLPGCANQGRPIDLPGVHREEQMARQPCIGNMEKDRICPNMCHLTTSGRSDDYDKCDEGAELQPEAFRACSWSGEDGTCE